MPAPLVGKNIMNIKENKESVYLKDFCSRECLDFRKSRRHYL